MAEDSSTNSAEVFVYTEGVVVPADAVRVRVHSSVAIIQEDTFQTCNKLEEVELCEGLLEIGEEVFVGCVNLKRISIPSTVSKIGNNAFFKCSKLQEIELCEGLLEIGYQSFFQCNRLKNVKIPSTVRCIGGSAFAMVQSIDVQLPYGLEEIGHYAFMQWNYQVGDYTNCSIPMLRIPALVRRIPTGLLWKCNVLFSLEISENVTGIEKTSISSCRSLRNVALTSTTDIENNAFDRCTDLQQLHQTGEQLINALKHRFDDLPIHKMIYYQSYNNVTVDQLNDATNIKISQRRSKLDPSGNQQDCLGMTPLRIIACSTVQSIELYKVLIDKYPETLVTEDRWGALPLLYAVWGSAPDEIVKILVDSYKSLYPDHVFNWTEMIATLSKSKVNNCVFRTLVDIQQEMKPNLDREEWINGLAMHEQISCDAFQFLVQCGYTERVNAIGLKKFRDVMIKEMKKPIPLNKVPWLNGVRLKFFQCEDRYKRLKEATTILELALWKYKMDKSDSKKKRKRTGGGPDLDFRAQCRVSCNADMVIDHVLPYLLPLPSDSVYK